MDILTIDVLVEAKTGKEWVMEVNGSASGFFDHQDQLELGKSVWERIDEVSKEMKAKNEAEEMMIKLLTSSQESSSNNHDDDGIAEMKKKRQQERQAALSALKK